MDSRFRFTPSSITGVQSGVRGWFSDVVSNCGLSLRSSVEKKTRTPVDNSGSWHRIPIQDAGKFLAYWREMQLDFIRPDKPKGNAFIESFNDRLQDERLNVHQFPSLSMPPEPSSKRGGKIIISADLLAHSGTWHRMSFCGNVRSIRRPKLPFLLVKNCS